MNNTHQRTALVLGSGIQGVLSALALTHAGWRVALVDRAHAPLMGASLSGEGKLHLGYVYGNEPGRATAGLMVEGALRFAELTDTWMPKPIDWRAISSAPFVYAILADSMVPQKMLLEHYHWVDDAIEAQYWQGARYAGIRTFSRCHPIADVHKAGFSGDVVAAYQTSEVAVDPYLLRAELIDALHIRGIDFYPNRSIQSVTRQPYGFAVTSTNRHGNTCTQYADAVVNCLWDGRLAVDASLDIPTPRPCMYRLKFVVNVKLDAPATAPLTTTFALGPYGDVVRRGDGRVYLSWYPVCLGGLSVGMAPPETWRDMLTHPDYMAERMRIATATVSALAERIQALRNARIESVTGGVVVAWGDSDIDTPHSELHRRHAIGVYDHDGYLSVDTGKLTTAPLFAARVAELLGRGKPVCV